MREERREAVIGNTSTAYADRGPYGYRERGEGPLVFYRRSLARMGGSLSLNKFGPKAPDHPTVGKECPACKEPFEAGDHTTLIALGPADDEEQRRKAREGRPYNALAVEVHWACATGEEEGS